MERHPSGAITYTREEVDALKFAFMAYETYVASLPASFEDVFSSVDALHRFRVGEALAHGRHWSDEDEASFQLDYRETYREPDSTKEDE